MSRWQPEQQPPCVNIAISQQRLADLLNNRALTVSDIQCLDAPSKRTVWQTCLQASLKPE